ncbi:hypothetical protein [Methylobacterium sp. J-070]|uniref:hypothetical protein n=1 Tax=Methylobacterium sp. J-070 TaxID=2836650 RepID=UPI001FBB7766|nr:hypothetical protein [Methylobacterium sp. J-070]MCJ2053700.1 hypothetical protein [Methylobacterium sp. J-070]
MSQRRLIPMRSALDDPALFGEILPGKSWALWRILLIASQGETLSAEERLVFLELTGREREPDAPVDEFWGVFGRRAGKTRAFAILAVYYACLIDYADVRAPGERLKVVLLAATTKQATKAFTYIRGIIEGVPLFANMMDGEPTADTIRLTNGVDIEIRPANYRTIRGETLVCLLCDEVAYWHTADTAANPDSEILGAARPALATTGGPLYGFSSPYSKRGELWNTFKRDFGPDGDPSVLVAKGASRTMNPTLSEKVVDRAYKADPAAAAAEYGGEFRNDIEAFITLEAVQACIPTGVRERPPVAGIRYRAFVDVSGGGSDSHVLAIAHHDGEVAVLDAVRELQGSPDAVTVEFAGLLKTFGVTTVVGDNYGAAWVRDRFAAHGVTYQPSEKNKSDIYREFLPILNSEQCRLLDVPKLEAQLVALERRTTRGTGRDIIDHPQMKGAHDDVANAVAGAITVAKIEERRKIIFTRENIEQLKQLTQSKRPPHQMFARRR